MKKSACLDVKYPPGLTAQHSLGRYELDLLGLFTSMSSQLGNLCNKQTDGWMNGHMDNRWMDK